MTIQCSPAELNTRITDAVEHGAWTPAQVTAAVGQTRATRSDIVDTLWALVEGGRLVAGHHNGQFGFRPVSTDPQLSLVGR